jgi:uncharacterized membrane protein YgcG
MKLFNIFKKKKSIPERILAKDPTKIGIVPSVGTEHYIKSESKPIITQEVQTTDDTLDILNIVTTMEAISDIASIDNDYSSSLGDMNSDLNNNIDFGGGSFDGGGASGDW